MKKKTLTTIILIVALAMVAAVTVYAVANYGTKEDPLVTSSYLQDVVQPRMEPEDIGDATDAWSRR